MVAVGDGYVEHAVTVEVGGVQAVGLTTELALERPAV